MPTVGTDPIAGRGTYIGLFLVTLATLMYEILLTRIFSVTVNYHSAFFAISVAMLGMTVGALIVYLRPHRFAGERVHGQMLVSALLFSVFMVLGFLVHLVFPFYTWTQQTLTCVALALPFTFAGITVCLALTKFPWQVGRLYGTDLVGAALGCVLLIWVLDHTDAGTAVVISAALASLGAVCISAHVNSTAAQATGLVLLLGFGGFALYNARLANAQDSMLRLVLVKGQQEVEERKPDYVKWNSFSRIQVNWHQHQPNEPTPPFGWGLSPKAPMDRLVKQRAILIDAMAGTAMTEFSGTLTDQERTRLEFLKYDISNLAHHLLDDAKILVVGAGGGRDLLSALVFDQREAIGVEINDDILDVMNGRYGRFTGHLDRHPRIKLVNDEARSYVARQQDQGFDMIQVSLIDTWAATAAGAFALTENSLYTVEAWQLFLRKLTDRGMLSFSRWYDPRHPGEAYRLTSLASTALSENGIADPREHIALVSSHAGQRPADPLGVATILVSRNPFGTAVLDQLETVVRKMGFEVLASPRQAKDPVFERLASGRDLAEFAASFPINILAPTDDRPFFFNMLRLRDLLAPDPATEAAMPHNLNAIRWLGTLLLVVFGLTGLFIVGPLLLTFRRIPMSGSMPLLLFFSGIGLGFLMIEIALMQRLILFLGHPTYGLAVVLFALLLAGGCGAYLSQRMAAGRVYRRASAVLLLLLVFLWLFGTFASHATGACEASTTPVRILVAGGLVFLLGLPMGTAFPLGMSMAHRCNRELTPWLWGINGATSVCASVLATGISLIFGITAAYWTGAAAYGAALLAIFWLALMERRLPTG